MAENTEGQAGQWVSTLSPTLSAIPIAGPILSTVGSVVGGVLQQDAAKKQQAQAANERAQANRLQPRLTDPLYWQKLHADKMASLSHMPGFNEYIDQLSKNSANQMRSILESSPNGAATLAAIAATHEKQNEAINTLGIQDSAYKAGAEKTVREDLNYLGGKRDTQQEIADAKRALMYQQANALETASTANKQTGWNQILGGLSSGVTQLTKSVGDNQTNNSFNQWYNNYIGNQPLGSITPMGSTAISSTGNSGLGMTFSPTP